MASQGPNSPATGTSVTLGATAWTNPGNVVSSNNANATCTIGLGATDSLRATDYGFTIPSGATIDGVIVEIERNGQTPNWKDISVNLIKGGVVSGSNYGATGTVWPGADAYATYGGAADLWGLTLSDTDVNATDFGVALQARCQNFKPSTGSVDHMRITIHYTAASGPATNPLLYIGD